jgi:HK97 gp10 family phage protein
MTIVVKGMPELINNLRELEVNIPYALGEAGRYSMEANVEAPAKERCPVDTGLLRTSIHTMVTRVTGNHVTVQTGTNVVYAPYVEFGTGIYAVSGTGRQTPWIYEYKGRKGTPGIRTTRGQKPQPFLTVAYEMNANRIGPYIVYKLKEMIENAARNKKISTLRNYYGGV